MVNIEINGIPLQAKAGSMVIEVADAAGIIIPRFCYHKKLSIAANCRMCLVEVERAPKPLPACATPVAEGMKVYTRSPKALTAQKAVMEFLLINHPLDCPVCDQGGECPLQETAMGFGKDVSRYTLGKRAVPDPDLGPLVATDMTRCIHCTRCVRFGEEIAGIKELGATGRGEHMTITTHVAHTLESELAGNIIDLCPVGALTSKPYRFSARPWELFAHPSIAPHDSLGSHVALHLRAGKVMRVLPREAEDINEVWISDRDRFSYQGLYSEQRLTSPRIREGGTWRTVEWSEALELAANGLKKVHQAQGGAALGALLSPTATLEEIYLTQKLMRGLGSHNIDHRLRQLDFSDQVRAPAFPWLGQSIAELEDVEAALVIGSHLRKEHPLVNHRLRKAALRGAKVMFANPADYEFNFPVSRRLVSAPQHLARDLAAVAKVLRKLSGQRTPNGLGALWESIEPRAEHEGVAEALIGAKWSTVLLGNLAAGYVDFSTVRALAGVIAKMSGARLGYLPEAANSVGAWLAGGVPHRLPGGSAPEAPGLDWHAMVDGAVKGYVLLGLEPELDCADPDRALRGLRQADFVVSLSVYRTPAMEAYCDVMLPVAPFSETSGTFVNAEGRWQSFTGGARPLGESRPAWKVLRVLGNLLDVAGFDYFSSEQVRDEATEAVGKAPPSNQMSWQCPPALGRDDDAVTRVGEVPIYSGDPLVRRAKALQHTPDGQSELAVRANAALVQRLGIAGGGWVTVRQGAASATLPLVVDDRVAEGCVIVPAGHPESAALGPAFGDVELTAAQAPADAAAELTHS